MTDYEKLQNIVDEIPGLIFSNVSASDTKFQAWKTKAERFLIKKYGKDSFECNNFKQTSFSLSLFFPDTPESEFIKACQNDLYITLEVFQTYLDEMREDCDNTIGSSAPRDCFSKIFIVHGHDGELKHSVARIIEKQGIEAIILSEQANQGKTIIEKFEGYSNVGGAICLFTADDIGQANAEPSGHSRARQNVVFETGYFIGKLGRDHIAILSDQGVEMPSDLSGIVYSDTKNWQVDLLKELRAMGYTVDLNLL